jgi:hypothetical protein
MTELSDESTRILEVITEKVGSSANVFGIYSVRILGRDMTVLSEDFYVFVQEN